MSDEPWSILSAATNTVWNLERLIAEFREHNPIVPHSLSLAMTWVSESCAKLDKSTDAERAYRSDLHNMYQTVIEAGEAP